MLRKWRWDFRSLAGEHFPSCLFAFPFWVHSLVLPSLSTCRPAHRPGSLPPSFSVSSWDCFFPLFAPFPRQRPFFMMCVLSHLLGSVGVRICGTLSPGGLSDCGTARRRDPGQGRIWGGTAASLKPGQSQQVSVLVVKGWLLAVSESGAPSGLSWLWASVSLPRPARALTPCTF